MLNYFVKKLEEEYHHLSLWYFVFFFYGVAVYFKSLDSLSYTKSFNNSLLFFTAISIILTFFVLFLRKKERFIPGLFTTILLSFILGMTVSCFRVASAKTNPITKVDIFDIEARVSEIKRQIQD